MKLLVDMNLSPRWIPFLLDAGREAVHWSTVGRADATDSEIMAFAAANDYVVLTNDLDFGAILASSHQYRECIMPRAWRCEMATYIILSRFIVPSRLCRADFLQLLRWRALQNIGDL